MNQFRYILSFLLVAGVAGVHAQQPIVKINSGSLATECDVTAAAGDPVFTMDATGNVLANGVLSGAGCGSSGGGTTPSAPTFGFDPPAAGLSINGGSSVQAGSAATVPLTYQAYNSASCSVGTPTTTGTCPAITVAGASCTGSAPQYGCSPTNATASVPTAAAMGTNTSCVYTAKATCTLAAATATSTATLTVTSSGTPPPPTCSGLASIGTGSGGTWSQVGSTTVKYGDGTTQAGIDSTGYVNVWTYHPPPTVAWPGNSGLSTRPTASINQYFAEKFTVPTDGSVTTRPNWAWSGSGINSNASFTISTCPGDFGQTGTKITTGCSVNLSNSASGLTATVSATQVGSFCSLAPGTSYYLNILPMANLPVNNVTTSSCTGSCTPWLGRN